MSIDFQYFTAPYAIEVHDNIIRESGGFMGIKDEGLIDSILFHMQNELYYPDIEHKITHLLFSFNKKKKIKQKLKTLKPKANLYLCQK